MKVHLALLPLLFASQIVVVEPAASPAIRSFIDGTAPGFRDLTAEDFTKVNSADDTWSWKDGVLHCTGKPRSVMRTVKEITNFEMTLEWRHLKEGGNSGIFVWAPPESTNPFPQGQKQSRRAENLLDAFRRRHGPDRPDAARYRGVSTNLGIAAEIPQ